MNQILFLSLGMIALLSFIVWIGGKIKPSPYKPIKDESLEIKTFKLPDGLPQPVENFYRMIYGDDLPHIETFIISGRGQIRFKGITLPAKLRFIHRAGRDYKHLIQTTFWGIPIMKANEQYVNWESRLVLPFGTVENEPKVNQAANLGLWSETLMFPAIYLGTEDVHWKEIDGTTAELIVPFKDEEDRFTVHFNPGTGLIDKMEALRYREPDDQQKTRWQAQALTWGEIDDWTMPTRFAAQWMDEETPWLVANIEHVAWNVDVSSYFAE